MNVTGIIAEYNPFHNGHHYQIKEAKKQADAVVAVMSGSFVQRGDVALYDKWVRAEAALLNGVDLVLELPVCYACATAERFAYGAVATLNALGIVDTLCFGSESGDIRALEHAAALLLEEPPALSEKIKRCLEAVLPFPAARHKAFTDVVPPSLLREPNNILELEYICALKKIKSTIKPFTIRRIGAAYHAEYPTGSIASAAAIRRMHDDGLPFDTVVPASAMHLYCNAPTHSISRLDTAVTYLLRTASPAWLRRLPDVTEGLEHRLIHAARQYDTFAEIAVHAKTKRYPLSRIRRILINALLHMDKDLCRQPPGYIRVLGMTQTGTKLLARAKNTCRLPIIVKTADYNTPEGMFQKDLLATDIAALCAAAGEHCAGFDFKRSPIVIKNLP